jgi:hypothetical protein
MAERQKKTLETREGFAIGAREFAAITAIEGLKLSPESERRLLRAETIRAFQSTPID